jgi:hypothetical protein
MFPVAITTIMLVLSPPWIREDQGRYRVNPDVAWSGWMSPSKVLPLP